MLRSRKIISSDVKSSRTSWPRGQIFVLVLGLGLEHFASAYRRTFYFGLVKMREMIILELVIIMCLQWLRTNYHDLQVINCTSKRSVSLRQRLTLCALRATCLSTASQKLHRYLTVINSEAFDPAAGQTWTRLPSSATTLLSHLLCAFRFSSSWENFLSKWHNHIVGTQRTHVKRCLRDTGLFEVQLSLVDHGRSL